MDTRGRRSQLPLLAAGLLLAVAAISEGPGIAAGLQGAVWDLSQTPATVTLTPVEMGGLAAGDFDGDGVTDFLLGGRTAYDRGTASVISNAPAVSSGAPGYSYQITGPTNSYGFDAGLGPALAAGDFNGDGIDDILASAPAADPRPSAGRVYVKFGAPGLAGSLDLSAASADLTVRGADGSGFGGDQIGRSLAAGDLNGDGVDDLAIGFATGDGPGAGNCVDGVGDRCQAGEVVVIFGAPALGGTIDLLTQSPGVRIHGAEVDDLLGESLAVGDINHDGVDDLVMGAVGADGPGNSRPYAGEVYVLFGTTSWPPVVDLASVTPGLTIYGADGGTVENAVSGDQLGQIVNTGDLDGDGIDDLLLGVPWSDGPSNARPNAGEVRVIRGGLGLSGSVDLAAVATGLTTYGAEGESVRPYGPGDGIGFPAAGDVNGDGVPDLVIGNPRSDGGLPGEGLVGSAYALFGPFSPNAVLDLATDTPDLIIHGSEYSSEFGKPVLLKDLDSDGLADVITREAAPLHDLGLLGSLQVIRGCPGDLDCDIVDNAAEAACGAPANNGAGIPERVDGIFAGVDDDGDGLIDEPLPPSASAYDCDGDGYSGAAEDNVFGAPARSDQDPCGTTAWSADFVSGGVPNSTNRVTITDLTSFLAPERRINTSPGDAGYDVRWDLAPGAGMLTKVINIADLTSVIMVAPPMLYGARAFNGPSCPWAP